jgi:hypothetical protein
LWGGEQTRIFDHFSATGPQLVAQGRSHEVLGLGDQDALSSQVDHLRTPENSRFEQAL